tara:strand:+ start:905 stop:4147 length:3243 start_codon:yes stop_codon:yes gene_type:complete
MAIVNSKANLIIGGHNDEVRYLDGSLAGVAAWSTVLTAATAVSIHAAGKNADLTVASNYTAGSGVDNSGNLLGYWPLDEGAGIYIDDKDNTTFGTLYGGTWINNIHERDHTKGWRFFVSHDDPDSTSAFSSSTSLKLNFVQACATTNAHYQTDAVYLPLKEWSQVGFSRPNLTTTPKMYVNGVERTVNVITVGDGDPVTDAAEKLVIGNTQDNAYNFRRHKNLSGELQEIAVFSDEKAAADMLSFYNSGETHDLTLDAEADNMISYWQVDSTAAPYHFVSKTNSLYNLSEEGNSDVSTRHLFPIVDHLNIFDSTHRIVDPSGWDNTGFADFTLFTNNSIVPEEGINTIGIGTGLSLKTWQTSLAAGTSSTHSHNLILVPSFFGFVVPSGSGSGYAVANQEQFWRIAFVYDGVQEGELSTSFIPDWNGDSVNTRTVTFFMNPDILSKRISHVMFFRATSDTKSNLEPDSFYRLVKNIRLDQNIDSVVDPALGTLKSISFTDTGTQTATYDAMVGISETVFRTMPNYKLSAFAGGSLFAANCFHSEGGGNLHEYIFKSKPYKYDQFDWTLDYITLPDIPTALEAHNGKVYAFTKDKTIRINPTSLYIEDEFSGAGCLNDTSIVSTEFGLFYFDKNNIYMQRGGVPEPIGHPILKSSDGSIGFQEIMSSYDEDTFKARAIFDGEKNAIMFVLSTTRAWVYSIQRDRWDLWETSSNSQIFFNETGDPWYISKGLDRGKFVNVYQTNNVTGVLNTDIFVNMPTTYKYGKDATRQRAFEWESKRMDMQIGSQEKFFYQVDTVYSGTAPTVTYGADGAVPTQTGTVTSLTDHRKIKIASGDKKKKDLKVKIAAAATSSTSVASVSLLSHGILMNSTESATHTMLAGQNPNKVEYTNIPTIDLDGSGTGCTIDFTLMNYRYGDGGNGGLGNISISAPTAGIITFTTTYNHSFVEDDLLFITRPSGRQYSGAYKVLATGLAAKVFKATQQSNFTDPMGSAVLNVIKMDDLTVNQGGSGYTTGVYLPDTHTNIKRRLLVAPHAVFDDGEPTIGNKARIIINIDSITSTTLDPTTIDAVGVIYRPPSKVKQ